MSRYVVCYRDQVWALFMLYRVPGGDVVCKYDLTYHVYADDKVIYIPFKSQHRTVQITENCLIELHTWFVENVLQLCDDKTILLIICPWFKPVLKIPYIQVWEIEIITSATATNLDVIFD